MIRVFVADDHAMFRDLLRMALPRNGDLLVVGEAEDARSLGHALLRSAPDVLLLDYKMPYMRNFGATVADICSRHPDTGVIVLTSFSDPEIVGLAADAGARGFVLKTTHLQAVADAIRSVANGGVWIDPNLPRQTFDLFQRRSLTDPVLSGLAELTRREREILACVSEGLPNAAIARKLTISEDTVKTHLTHIFAKLGVKNRVGAAVMFYQHDGGAPTDRRAAS